MAGTEGRQRKRTKGATRREANAGRAPTQTAGTPTSRSAGPRASKASAATRRGTSRGRNAPTQYRPPGASCGSRARDAVGRSSEGGTAVLWNCRVRRKRKMPWFGERPAAAATAARQMSAGVPTEAPRYDTVAAAEQSAAAISCAARRADNAERYRPTRASSASEQKGGTAGRLFDSSDGVAPPRSSLASYPTAPSGLGGSAAGRAYGFTSGGTSPTMPAATASAAAIARSRLPPAIFSQSASE